MSSKNIQNFQGTISSHRHGINQDDNNKTNPDSSDEEKPKKKVRTNEGFKNIEELLSKIKNITTDKELFTESQINELTSITFVKYKNTYQLVSMENLHFVYDVVGYCQQNTDKINDFIENLIFVISNDNIDDISDYDILFESIAFHDEIKKYYFELEQSREKLIVTKGLYPCPKCKSKLTISIEKQTRSADEAATSINTCTKCGKKWNVSG